MNRTGIEWTEVSWNPVTGCSKTSPGCQNCYAERMAKRLAGRYGYPADEPFRVTLQCDRLQQPLFRRKPRRIFVNSMSDTFHPDVPFEFIRRIWLMAADCPQHTFLFLTKRPERMLEFTRWMAGPDHVSAAEWPRNCRLGVTAENQEQADRRIPILLQTPAAVRFVSIEPCLGPVDLRRFFLHKSTCRCPQCYSRAFHPTEKKWLDWVILGGESGPNARPVHPDWVRSVRDQCVEADVPFFFKQMKVDGKLVKMPELDGRVWDQRPEVRR